MLPLTRLAHDRVLPAQHQGQRQLPTQRRVRALGDQQRQATYRLSPGAVRLSHRPHWQVHQWLWDVQPPREAHTARLERVVWHIRPLDVPDVRLLRRGPAQLRHRRLHSEGTRRHQARVAQPQALPHAGRVPRPACRDDPPHGRIVEGQLGRHRQARGGQRHQRAVDPAASGEAARESAPQCRVAPRPEFQRGGPLGQAPLHPGDPAADRGEDRRSGGR